MNDRPFNLATSTSSRATYNLHPVVSMANQQVASGVLGEKGKEQEGFSRVGLLLWGTCGIPGSMHGLRERVSSEEWLGIRRDPEATEELPDWKVEV